MINRRSIIIVISGEEAMQLYKAMQPDIMVMDISMPGIGGLEAIRRICARDSRAKILVFSVSNSLLDKPSIIL
jgi:DNA-binding NarL/FixJ family response regulator